MGIVRKCLTLSGFVVGSLASKYADEFYATVPSLIKSGEIKYKEEVHVGLDKVGLAFYNIQTGKNKAKTVVIVAQE